MKTLISKGLLIVSLVIFGLASCEKEEGPTGPPGTAGEDGKDGNANVKTELIKVYGYEWKQNGPTYIVDKNSDLLTQDIVDNGSAHLYLEVGESIWAALPHITMGYAVGVNVLSIWTEGSVSNQTVTFKLVVIEGNMQTNNKTVDFNDYESVKEHYKLTD